MKKLSNTIPRLDPVEIVSQVGPWLAPVPTAWLVFDRSQTFLEWPAPIAFAAALSIEMLGLAATATALSFHDYNGAKNKSEPHAPVRLAAGLSFIYFAIAVCLTVLLDIVPMAATWAPAIFPLMSLVAVSILALRAGQRNRLAQNLQAKAERAAKRKARAVPSAVLESEPLAFEAVCKEPGCDWRKNGYPSKAGAINGLNAHMRKHPRKVGVK